MTTESTLIPPKFPERPDIEDWMRQVTALVADAKQLRWDVVEFQTGQTSGAEISVHHELGAKPDAVLSEINAGFSVYATEAQRRRWDKQTLYLTATQTSGVIRLFLIKDVG